MTSRKEIGKWFDEGEHLGAAYMIIVCDTFTYEDYPVFVGDMKTVATYNDGQLGNMQRVMEIYDLRQDKAEQMAEYQTFRLPK